MFEPIKEAWGRYLNHFYDELVATTPAIKEFKSRGFSQCFAYAPSRMVDQANEMLASWQKNDSNNKPTRPAQLPVVLVAIAKDYTPTGRDYTIQVADPIDIMIPSDDKERYFELKTVAGDIRVQVVICSSDEASAKSIAAQLLLYVDSPTQRGFDAVYTFAKNDVSFPCQIETPDTPASSIETGNKNITMLALDFNLHCTVPLYDAPSEGEPNDGTSIDENGKPVYNPIDPSGYPLVEQINQNNHDGYSGEIRSAEINKD